jgi:hypothetical protein
MVRVHSTLQRLKKLQKDLVDIKSYLTFVKELENKTTTLKNRKNDNNY